MLALLALALVGLTCQVPTLGRRQSTADQMAEALEELAQERHPDSSVISVLPVQTWDVDADGEEEWLLLYRFDRWRTGDFNNTPILGILYDAVTCEFPEFVSYKLPTPDNDYLSEGGIDVELTDFLDSGPVVNAAPELIIRGPSTRRDLLTIYRFRDEAREPCIDPARPRDGPQLVGYFDASVNVTQDPEQPKRIVTLDRAGFERSQLAIRSVYVPIRDREGAETYRTDAGEAVPPVEQSIHFAFGLPESPSDSPYPEKAVASFYLYIGVNTAKAGTFLTEELQANFPEGNFGLPIPVEQVQRVKLLSITYQPDPEKENQPLGQEVLVTVTVLPEPTAEFQTKLSVAPCTVTWRVRSVKGEPESSDDDPTPTVFAGPTPPSDDLEWRLAGIESVSGDPRCEL